MSDPALPRWAAMMAVRIAATLGAVLGVVLLGRAEDLPTRLLGLAIVAAALWVVAIVPKALAHRWRTPR
ncbi:MAG: hypothetical protein PGN23_12430 [Sphingomonas adhaesiva]|uniref:hypothetical protein n=1 Tax=Sphingomonas adhaesiva TaxID=28212 RepID=UPI002FF5959F